MKFDKESIIADLEGIFSKDRISSKEADRIAYAIDEWPLAKLWQRFGQHLHKPTCIVWPLNTDEVTKTIKYANGKSIPIIPAGGLTGMCGGTIPVSGGIMMDLKKMNKVIAVDEHNLGVKVQPGIIGQHLEDALAARKLTLGHSPSSIYCSTIGGFCSTRSAGQLSTKYGRIEDMVQGLEVVMPSGAVIATQSCPKRAMGPDLSHLFIGTEGTLGVITQVSLKLHRVPDHREWQGYSLSNLSDGLGCLREMIQRGARPALMRLYDEQASALLGLNILRRNVGGSLLLIECEGDRTLAEAEAAVCRGVAETARALPIEEDIVQHWWLHRYAEGYEHSRLASQNMLSDTIDVAAPWDALGVLHKSVTERLRLHCHVSAHFAQFSSQGGSVYFTMVMPVTGIEDTENRYRSAWGEAMKCAKSSGGMVTHHHGIGLLKNDWIIEEIGEGYSVLKTIKSAMDPNGILNPGKLGL